MGCEFPWLSAAFDCMVAPSEELGEGDDKCRPPPVSAGESPGSCVKSTTASPSPALLLACVALADRLALLLLLLLLLQLLLQLLLLLPLLLMMMMLLPLLLLLLLLLLLMMME